MRRWIPLVMVLIAAGSAHAQEYDARVIREVEVRSGPSARFYATGKLRLEDKVHVKANHGEYVAIDPPPDAFSLVPKQAVRRQGIIDAEAVDTYQGSTLVGECNVKGTRLVLGTQVSILEEVQLKSNLGPAAFYKIVPLNESRYIPADAIRKQDIVPAGGAGAPPAAAGGVQPASGVPNDQIGAWLVKADNAYKRGQANGDFTEAKRLYDDLLRCNDHQARGVAQVRLSYIKKYAPHLFPGSNVGTANPAGGSSPRYTSGPATSFDHARGSTGTAPRQGPPPATLSGFRPLTTPLGDYRGANNGVLKRAVTQEQGRQVYYLADEQGRTKFYVAPATGVDLEPFVDQKIEVAGGPMVFRHDLKGNYLVAVSARRVQ